MSQYEGRRADWFKELIETGHNIGGPSGQIVAAMEHRERTGPVYYPPNACGDARQLPELRHALIEAARDGSPWHHTEVIRVMNLMCGNPDGWSNNVEHEVVGDSLVIHGPKGYGPDEIQDMALGSFGRAENGMHWFRRNLADAQLIHVAPDLCEVLFSSLDSMPDERVLQADDAPTPSGLCVFAAPWTGIDSGSEFDTVRVDGILWGPVMLPARENWMASDEHIVPGFAVGAFRWMDPQSQEDENMQADMALATERGIDTAQLPKMWMSLGRTDWCIGDMIMQPTHDGIEAGSKNHASMVEDRKLIAALWALITQRRLVERTTVTAPRHAAKRLERAGDTLSRNVEVIHLRRPEYTPRHDDGSTGRRIGVRYAVRPFWRNQAWGPAHSLRKLILIPAHMRGPEGAPLSNIERVWEVDR